MRLFRGVRSLLLLWSSSLILSASAEYVLQTTSLSTCQDDSGFQASLFDVVYTPSNNSAAVDMTATSTVEGYVIFDISITAYGYEILRKTIDPCTAGDGFKGFCPMSPGNLNNPFNIPVDSSAKSQIPSIAYTFPDIDAKVKVFINKTDSSGTSTGESVACVQASVSNGKTVDLPGVKWASAVVAGLALASSALMSGLGHQNAASHVAANALSLTTYFQAQAMIGLVAIPLPPSVQAWTQDFQWSMGIIYVEFMQTIFTWYQRATGGTPSTLFNSLTTVSVQVQKRSLTLAQPAVNLFRRARAMLPRNSPHCSNIARRSGNIRTTSGDYIVYGIQRVAFRAGIESTNLFITGLVFYCVILVLSAIAVVLAKYFCEAAVKMRWMKTDTFLDFRRDWRTHCKGILFRITLIGFPPVTILCLWEFTQGDSAAEIVLAVGFFVGLLLTLGWAAFNVIRLATRSIKLHRNPAYALFADAHALNKWGFLYIQFRASAYYFIVPVLGYTLIKSMFIAFGQKSGITQAIAFILLESAALIAATVMRPWMDKSTNGFNIAICVVNFLNAIFLLIFTNVFDQPGLFTGIVGMILWILNAVMTLILLLILIITTVVIFFKSNPDGRYQMADDRTSFMKSSSQVNATMQLDALAATARGDKAFASRLDLDDEEESEISGPSNGGYSARHSRVSTDSRHRTHNSTDGGSVVRHSVSNHNSHNSISNNNNNGAANNRSSNISASTGGRPRSIPSTADSSLRDPSRAAPVMPVSPLAGSRSMSQLGGARPRSISPNRLGAARSLHSMSEYRRQNNPSPWQRGVGFDEKS